MELPYFNINTLRPPLSLQEATDFLATKMTEDPKPEPFKNYIKMGPIIKLPDVSYVPAGLLKKEYAALLTELRKELNELKMKIREEKNAQREPIFLEIYMEEGLEKERNLEKHKATAKVKYDGSILLQAKQVPIDSLLEFKAGFASCPSHPDKTPSMKFYPKENRFHCFSCGADGDSVDLVMAINNVSMSEALKLLVRS